MTNFGVIWSDLASLTSQTMRGMIKDQTPQTGHRTAKHAAWLSRLRGVVAGLTLSGSVSLELVAIELATSPRTLQRRLREHGLQFGKIVEETRLGIAAALLRETELNIQDISIRVGYSTPSSFTRAFGRWSGLSPKGYRSAAAQEGAVWREMGRTPEASSVVSTPPAISTYAN